MNESELYAAAYEGRPLSPDERAWCVTEAVHFGEGSYQKEECEKMTDKYLALAVFDAWNSYVQTNCM